MALGLGKYLKAAFMNRWNLLAVAGGAAFALISGRPDILLPLLAAAEVAYVTGVGTHPKFRKYIDVEEAQGRVPIRASKSERDSRDVATRILKSLPPEARDRFKGLRARLLELRQIASDLHRHEQKESGRVGLEGFQLEGLDRLLWVFLRLQFTQTSVARFLERTDEDQIEEDIKRLEKRLEKLNAAPVKDPVHHDKIQATLMDNLETSKSRLENYRKAVANNEYIELELDRLENKITSLAELGVNRQEPTYITSQVDQVAESMLNTEETLSELDFVTHLGPIEEEPPELLRQTIYITD